MCSPDIKLESMVKRIENIVTILMEENPFFKEDLNYAEMVEELVKRCQKNLSFEEFNAMSNEQLKEYSSSIMAIEMLGKIGESFTPEQMATFDDAVKRK